MFKENYLLGKEKKNKLVYDLVSANKMKQAEVLYILKTRSEHLREEEKKERVEELFADIFKKTKKNLCLLYEKQRIFSFLTKIMNNYSKNVGNSFHVFRSLPPRVNWSRRDKVLKLHSKLLGLVHTEKNKVFSKFKYSHQFGRFKMMKAMDIMAYKYLDVTKRNFNRYRNNVSEIKANLQHKAVSQSFSDIFDLTKSQFEIMFMASSVWTVKAQYINKFNDKAKERLGQAFRLWHETAKALTHFNTVKNEKKKRLIEILNGLVDKGKYNQTKKIIHHFHKNSKISKIQTHFLKRLCDSQAGKVVKAMMIWKNLPEQKDPKLIGRATKFQGNL